MAEITLLEALMAEHEALGGKFFGTRPASLPALWTELHRQHREGERSRAALCLSGGGIRSATFALGVLQGLAARGLLSTFDYLSTVSGGGYVGGWLSAWIHRSGGRMQNVESALGAKTPTDPQRIAELNPREPLALRHLREYSNYLTPRLGLFSADTWTLIATYLRNLLLNWLALIPLIAAFLLLPRLLHAVIRVGDETAAKGLMLVGLILLAMSVIAMTWWRPTVYQRWKHRWATTEPRFLAVSLVPLLLGSLILVIGWAWLEAAGRGRPVVEAAVALLGFEWVGRWFPAWMDPLLPQLAAIGLVAHLAAALVSAVFVRSKVWWWEAISGAIAGTLAGIGAWGLVRIFPALLKGWDSPLYTILAVPALLGVLLVATTVFVGLMSRWTDDEDREWWARYGGWILVSGLAWTVIATLVLYGPPLFDEGWKAMSVAGVSGIWALIVGWSGFTAANDKSVRERVGLKAKVAGFALDHLTTLAAVVFLVGLVIALSWASTPLIASIGGITLRSHEDVLHEAGWPHVLVAGLGLFAMAMAVGLFLHVNRFSLHAMYRSRLIRAFLGASKAKRTPHPVTGFDPDDNVEMADLAPDGRPQRPFHIVNMALNLVGGADLAWQQRQAESFTVSPLHAGSSDPRLGYRSSAEYGKGTSHAITLGTAIAISGAAVSPNMGYNSSPAVTCVLALFNVRLGWWLGNPGPAGNATFNRAGPRLYFGPMLSELLGWTDNRHKYVYLSDGGHFENLGLYEMVLRRCHFIVVSDAGCDPEGALDDLGNAIRKIRTDFGISITLDQTDFKIAPRATATLASRYCAIGVIHYKDSDGADAENGILVYVKPGCHGDEPKDIFNYATAHPAFPHESTTDQWFSESQFESYRALGRHAADRMCAEPPDAPPQDGRPLPAIDLAEFLKRIRQYLVLK